ncbi:MAG: hypothetical protein KJO07_02325 [Deltaproteobacteria bacterium]|nr:hypothetical protein [Deltaproteobacteria bacterium]
MRKILTASAAIGLCLAATSPALADSDLRVRGRTFAQGAIGVGQTSYQVGMDLSGQSSTDPAALLIMSYALSERWSWLIPSPALAYRFGTAGERELVPALGLFTWGLGYSSVEGTIFQGTLGSRTAYREYLDNGLTVNLGLHLDSPLSWTSGQLRKDSGPDSWRSSLSAGLSWSPSERVELNLGAEWARPVLLDGALADDAATTWSFGSVQTVGFRRLPLLSYATSEHWSIDGYAELSVRSREDANEQRVRQVYLLGATWSR